MSDSSGDKRRFSRIPFECKAEIISAQRSWPTRLIDVSLKGALVDRPADWQAEAGEEFTLEIVLNDDSTVICMEVVTVAHVQEQCIGFSCKYIDVDSITHLKRLVELNLGDAELWDRELSALGRL